VDPAQVPQRAESVEAMEFLVNKMQDSKTNKKFLESMNQ
jgi:transcription termination factor Rho